MLIVYNKVMAEYKEYTVNIGSTHPIYFKSAYTGGQASAKFNGTIVITTQNEGFEDAGSAASDTAAMISSDFGSALLAELTDLYAYDETADPSLYEVDKSALITRMGNYSIKNGYSVININYMNVEVDATKVEDTTDTDVVEEPATNDVAKNETTQPANTEVLPEKKDPSAAPVIIGVVFGVFVIIGIIVAVIVAKSKKTPAAPAAPVAEAKPEEKAEEKPEEKIEEKPEEKTE